MVKRRGHPVTRLRDRRFRKDLTAYRRNDHEVEARRARDGPRDMRSIWRADQRGSRASTAPSASPPAPYRGPGRAQLVGIGCSQLSTRAS
jgi:hypothetical protein